ncbi:MAG: alpha-ketoacid dehydrogenase subunit beta [Candidatus Pacebacteria bacterium]|nr:alpha-ketoacid dehydrogenase subunit beta [Candidatus Paceibacterota bacterium]
MREISYTDALREALREEMARDATVFVLGEDIAEYGGAFGVTRGLLDAYGSQRVLNTPISEPGFTGAAIGAALTGTRPVVEIMFMDFIGLVTDQLVNQAAKLHYVLGEQAPCPLVVRTAGGGGRCYGPTHSQTLEAWFMHVPGIKIVVPSTPADAKGLLKTAIRDDNPVLFIEHKMLYSRRGNVLEGDAALLPFGRARCITEGDDLTMIAWSWMSAEAEAAAKELEAGGVSVDLFDPRTLAPLDMAPLEESVRKTGRALIVEEGCRTAGVSAEIACRLFECVHEYLDAPIRRLASPDVPVPASPVLEEAMIPDRNAIVQAAIELVQS